MGSDSLEVVATKEEWDELVVRMRAEGLPLHGPLFRRFYELALSDGPRFLAPFKRSLGEERAIDLVHDLLAEKLEAILAAETPRALFFTALHNRARSWLRRQDAQVVESPPDSSRQNPSGDMENDARHAFVLDARDALAALSERDRGIVVAAALGEDREVIAREFKTSRANVDQIASRLQKRFRKGGK